MEKLEIERRFLASESDIPKNADVTVIEQVYADFTSDGKKVVLLKRGLVINSEGLGSRKGTLRIRITDSCKAEMNFKVPSGMYRHEFEEEIPLTEEIKRLVSEDEKRIVKTRHSLETKSAFLAYDIFGGRFSGIVIMEAEFRTPEDAQRFEPEESMAEIFPEDRLSNREMYFSKAEEILERIKEKRRSSR